MGLTKNIEDALMKSLGGNISSDAGKGNIPELAKDIADAVIDFIQQQTFTITEMKAILEVEKMSTLGPLTADVLPSVTTVVAPGIPTAGSPAAQVTVAPGTGVVSTGTKGVLVPPINFSKTGGQGGVLSSRGYAYIGTNPVSSGEKNDKHKETKVKLLKIERGTA